MEVERKINDHLKSRSKIIFILEVKLLVNC